jgi:glycosyltransferase involved in cell wall biosynthesis
MVALRMVGISLLTLVPGVVGGSETYARELARWLARVGTLEYHVFVPSIAPDAGEPLPRTVVRAYRASRTTAGRLAAMARASIAPGAVRRELALERLAVLHFPLTVMIPPVRGLPTVTSILDVQHELQPQHFSVAERAYRKLVYARTARLSTRVIAISEHVQQTLVERLGVAPERIRVVQLGVDPERFRSVDAPREPFLLYPANRWPHKNHDRLLAAFAQVRRERPELRLVLTGAGHEGRTVPDGVVVRGHVPQGELIRLYQTAAALVFPSLYEGFGQPVLEAMACGCPVAASDAGGLPEVCGDAALLFDPTSVDEIAAAMLRIVEGAGDLAARGLERARPFTWEACARRHEEVYRELGAERPKPGC